MGVLGGSPLKRVAAIALSAVSFPVMILAGCGSAGTVSGGGTIQPPPLVATPVIVSTPALNGAVTLSFTDSTAGSTLYYTLDGTTPTATSPQYLAPFFLAANETVNVIAIAPAGTSAIASKQFSLNIASGTLVWSDEFSNSSGTNAQPNPSTWTYDTGNSGFGNQELENYCAWGSTTAPCDPSNPNAYVGTDGYLHIVARQPSSGTYTSARLKSQGLFSLGYGRLEASIKIPEGQGLWPAFWLVGNNYATVNWPACGEQDIMEHVNSPTPDWVLGSVHMPNQNLSEPYPPSYGPGFDASQWHTYGMIWSPGKVEYYVDSPNNIYATYTPADLQGIAGAVWPFDSGGANFILLNLAVGGDWPGAPDSTTVFPSEMLVDYVRVYAN
jgi:beta-glucanase (GH16 family)